ncbi:ABC transporter ATP-binding protein [Clostridium algoriphilum]|uniref:ABC transporter ATP-binding protein n=1 Tax=Clostridium algoriphilum TaxID=198347 RepID=UPI001CF285E4|nr:ABC transporter ATP-binding protein [Clostridium algoriphilum]MCB2293531.1 ABC transporter ATP-binding protein [Clostridium algoriphilum]
MENEKILCLKGISKKFKGIEVLKNINLNMNKGEVVGIVGSNGSGKTTLLRIIMGLIYPNEGVVKVDGNKVLPGLLAGLPTSVGALIENPIFLPQFTGYTNLRMLASIRNVINDDDIKSVIKLVGLDINNKKTVEKYSLGMRQRLGIAQAIMEKPSLILFDEPTNGLDSNGVEIFKKIVKNMKSAGSSFIIVSHRREEIDELSDSIYEIENGSLTILRDLHNNEGVQ